MHKVKDAFLAQFDPALVSELIRFGERIPNIQADVIIVMARKAVCLLECLEEIGLTSLNGIVTSDRVLDMDTTWLRGKKIALIDGLLISGTSLYEAKEQLWEAEVAAIEVYVLCINEKWWSKSLVQPIKPYLSLSDKETMILSSSIVNAISLVPRPYSVDYPFYEPFEITNNELSLALTSTKWEVFKLTSTTQQAYGVFSYTLIPSSETLIALDQSLGWDFSKHSQLMKIRLYGRANHEAHDTFSCCILSLAVLDPLDVETVGDLFNSLLSHSDVIEENLRNKFKSSKSKLRLIQYIVASTLGNLWIQSVNEPTVTITTRQNKKNLNYSFQPHLKDIIYEISEKPSSYFSNAPASIQISSPKSDTFKYDSKFNGQDLLSLQARLLEPFLDFYWTKELRARELALRYGPDALKNEVYIGVMSRLKTGLSMLDIRMRLQDVKDLNIIHVENFVSIFIDIAIDRGAIVPITVEVGKIIYRGYRHGEDIIFTDNEARLFCLMLQEVSTTAGREYLPHLWVEKLFVLLVRIGVQRKFLERWYGLLGEPNTIGVRYALKGAVVQRNAPTLYNYNPDGQITRLFLDADYLIQEKVTELYKVNDVPYVPMNTQSESEARSMGYLFGKLLSSQANAGNRLLSDDDLVLIATCLSPHDTVTA